MYPTYVPAHDPTAVVGRRIGAWIIDAAIGFILVMVLLLTTAENRTFFEAEDAVAFCDDVNNAPDPEYLCTPVDNEAFLWEFGELGLIGLVGLGFWFLNDAVLTGITGFSIGKGLVGLRVVRQSDGRLAGFGRALGRWALWIVDWAPWCVPAVGLITGLTTKGHRRVGDMVAGTFVVDKRQVGHVPYVAGVNAPAAAPVYAAAPGWGAPFPGATGPGGWGPPMGAPGTPPWGPPPGGAPAPWGSAPNGTPPGVGWNPPPAADAPWAPTPPSWGAPPSGPWTPPGAPQAGPRPTEPLPPWAAPHGGPPAAAPGAPTLPEPSWAPPTQAQPWPEAGPTQAQPTQAQPTFPVIPGTTGDLAPTQQLPTPGTPGVDAPLWDDARDAYIQWDPEISRWVQWDEQAREWRPI